jgi:Fe-S-cluster containining protein
LNARPAASLAPHPASGPDTPAAIAEQLPVVLGPPADRVAADSAACLRCGVCCFSRLETYARVTGDDWTRLGPDADHHAHFIGHRAYMRMIDGHCAALALRPAPGPADPGRPGTALHVCTIYERRPQVCRDLARGSPECQAELALKGDRVAVR